MTVSETSDVKANRLSSADYVDNFSDIHPPLTPHEALVEADRCYFCYDAPCMTACPTSIDIPMFIRKIQAGNPVGSAKTIFEQNIMGGMCARVCPTETLCEEVCVRETAEGKPVKIGLLQRYATDTFMEREQPHPFTRAAPTGKKIAVIGAGPAGLSCAHRLATLGHDVTVYEAREKPAASTNMASPPTRRPMTLPRTRSTSSLKSAASPSKTARRSAATSRSSS
jgi:dihydropyrimidine dehydrogenase (NAD+) subunit PreT